MLIFPQLLTGAAAQYPIKKKISQRSVQSVMEDGTIISLADSAAMYARWELVFRDLSDDEANSFTEFFAATEGAVQSFCFLDPTANLLMWSQDLTQSVWTAPGVKFDAAVSDPFGGSAAQRAHNQTGTSLNIAQQTQIPGSVQTCFSVYIRADQATTATLTISSGTHSASITAPVSPAWQRFHLSDVFSGSTANLQYAIASPAGTALDIFGPQVDAQCSPSCYVATSGCSGVHPEARFDAPGIDRVATGPNRNICTIAVRCNLRGGV